MADRFSSPDTLRDELLLAGNDPVSLGMRVAAARQDHFGADERYKKMTSNDRAALDRYATFVKMAEDSNGPLEKTANYIGGMGAMGVTELAKWLPALESVLNRSQDATLGSAAEDFGGKDTSKPSWTNILASHHGFFEGLKRKK